MTASTLDLTEAREAANEAHAAHDADLFRRHAPHWPHPEPEEAPMTTASETTAPVAYGCCGHCDHDILVPLTMPPHARACLHEGCTAGQSQAPRRGPERWT